MSDNTEAAVSKVSVAIRAAAGVAILVTFFVLYKSWNQPILDQHAFRQTQTAISAYWISKNWSFFNYQTPVLGYPWMIPFELPVYQWIVAIIATLLPINLDQAGRVVSLGFFLLSYIPLKGIVRRINPDRHLPIFIFAILMLSPIYLFWSRAFLMESTALFFSLSFVYSVVKYLHRQSLVGFALMTIFAILAACIKITTYVSFSFAGAMFVIYDMWIYRRNILKRSEILKYTAIALSVILSVAVLEIWVQYSDALKDKLQFGYLLTSKNLFYWNFGNLHQRLSSQLWSIVFGRAMEQTLGSPLIFWIVAGMSLMGSRKTLILQASCFALYISNFLIFTNLHIVHDYYQYSNAIFLIIGVSLGIWEASRKFRAGAFIALFVCLILVELVGFKRYFYRDMINQSSASQTLSLANYLRKNTASNEVVVGFGLQWASDVPYYAERRAFLVPDWHVPKALAVMSGANPVFAGLLKIGAVVNCPNHLIEMDDMKVEYSKYMHLVEKTMLHHAVAGCVVYTSHK